MPAHQHLLWILPAVLLVVYTGSPRFLGAMAATRTKRLLDAHLEPPEFRLCHNIDLPTSRGLMHFDHVVISRSGIHVVDSLAVAGKVKGTEVQQTWKATSPWRTREFDNPVHANTLRIEALAQALGLPPSRFHGLVVLHGRFRLGNEMGSRVIRAEQLVGHLRSRAPEILTGEQMDRAETWLREALAQSPSRRRAKKWKAVQALLFAAWVIAIAGVFRVPIGEACVRLQSEIANASFGRTSVKQVGATAEGVRRNDSALNCAYSVDTGACACRNAAGELLDIEARLCQELSERGSILKQ